jgi:hypothetical protein
MLQAYTVAVKLSLVSNVSAGLAAMSKQFASTNAQAVLLQKKLAGIKAQAMTGAMMFGTGAAMAAPIVYAVTKAAELQKQLIAVQIATRGTTKEMVDMRRGIESIASQTIFSNIDVAKMGKLVATGTGLGATDVSKLLPAYAKFADVQYLMKGTNYDASVKDAIRLAHTAQHYSPDALNKYLDLLTKASMIVPGSLGEVGHALKYSQGIGKTALGIDDESMVLLTSLLNRLGFAGSRGGTNLIAAMTRTIPGIFGSGLLTGKSGIALNAMGMVGADGKSKFFKNGKFDSFSWMGGLSEYVQREFASNPEAIARQKIMTNFQHAFGTQGSRVASLLSDPKALEQLRTIGEAFRGYGGVDSMQEKFANESVSQKMFNAKTNFQSALTEIGYTLLPMAATGLTKLNRSLQGLIAWVTENPGKVKAMAIAFSALSGLLMAGGLINLAAAGFRGLALVLPILAGGGKASLLANVAVGLRGISMALIGNAGLVAAAAAASYAIGTIASNMLNKYAKWASNGKDDTFGGWFYSLIHNEPQVKGWSADGSRFIGFGDKKQVQVHTQVNLDGHKVATVVSKHQSKAAAQPQSGVSFADALMSMPSPANPY